MAKALRQRKGKRKGWVEIFCYTCKRYVPVTGTKELSPLQVFKNGGHTEDKVPFLAPDLGRSTRRYDAAMRAKVEA